LKSSLSRYYFLVDPSSQGGGRIVVFVAIVVGYYRNGRGSAGTRHIGGVKRGAIMVIAGQAATIIDGTRRIVLLFGR